MTTAFEDKVNAIIEEGEKRRGGAEAAIKGLSPLALIEIAIQLATMNVHLAMATESLVTFAKVAEPILKIIKEQEADEAQKRRTP